MSTLLVSRLELKYEVSAEEVRQAITNWMSANHNKIGFTREIAREMTGWNHPDVQKNLCGSGCSQHILDLVGVIPGIDTAKGTHIDLVVFRHKPENEDRPWELCSVWDPHQQQPGRRAQFNDTDKANELLRFLWRMPRQLQLPTS